jgi:hypothetical protein
MIAASMMFYHLYVIQMVERGISDASAGRLILHETVAEDSPEAREKVLG